MMTNVRNNKTPPQESDSRLFNWEIDMMKEVEKEYKHIDNLVPWKHSLASVDPAKSQDK